MEFNELVSRFSARHGIEGLAVEDGTAAIEVDGIAIALADVGGDMLASAVIGEPPAEGRADFADLLLEANLESDAFFGKSKESGRYVLSRRLSLAGLEDEGFDTALEALVNAAETWRRLLEDFRPVADAAAEADVASFSPGAFMQV